MGMVSVLLVRIVDISLWKFGENEKRNWENSNACVRMILSPRVIVLTQIHIHISMLNHDAQN